MRKETEAATLAELARIKRELMAAADATAVGNTASVEHKRVCAQYAARLQALSTVHKRQKTMRDRQRSYYRKCLTGNALEQALEALRQESRRDGAARRALKQERERAIAPWMARVAEAAETVRSLKQQYAALSTQLQQQLQATYFEDIESGKLEIEPLRILHQDMGLMVVDKPAGLLSVPGRRLHLQDSVLSRLRYQRPDCSFLQGVHRLDRDTSGVMAIALSACVHAALSEQFAQRQVRKVYVAVLSKPISESMTERSVVVDLPLSPDVNNRPCQVVDFKDGKPSRTVFRCLEKGQRPRVELMPYTGRTHQLRVHAAHRQGLNSPILGDVLYGGCTDYAAEQRLLLHAAMLEIVHPMTGEALRLQSPTPF